ncbi:hypothetical protein ADH76_03145 [Enterocloster clostridioformis]|uniref:hypothetical protein n=1 Tax=Enterocloster clostridioformis TaxID=1531 RepID=UPI00080CA24D|nr:hypothetical protein [Enterocloster clostridioformis]ANU44661.1 hypothetical protein A4V08_01285 [Lachnoclostridium sp. YL32]OXE70432.1 hypothetical protein ADH76_03145 [Enterocloster clostridioformis]QQR00584.1 hypothetical protein I5Q83_33375 [Enterocloster clostridioformis]
MLRKIKKAYRIACIAIGKKRVNTILLVAGLAEWKAAATMLELQQKDYFFCLKQTNLVPLANRLAKRQDFEVMTLSQYLPDTYTLGDKHRWCDIHVPNIDKEHRIFVPCGIGKPEYIQKALRRAITEDDILIDDYSKNLTEWSAAGGTAIKWLNGINGNGGTFQGLRVMWVPDLEHIITG